MGFNAMQRNTHTVLLVIPYHTKRQAATRLDCDLVPPPAYNHFPLYFILLDKRKPGKSARCLEEKKKERYLST